MGVLADWQIRAGNFITPFEEGVKRPGVISYGLSSYGYDCRLGYRFKVFNNAFCGEVDPKNFDPKSFVEVEIDPTHEFDRGRNCVHCEMSERGELASRKGTRCTARPDYVRIPPNSFVLGESLETFDIPRDVLAVCLGKSTYARCGLIVNVTPLEPEWKGKVTIEISNTTPLPARVYAGEGIMQVIFLRADGVNRQMLADFYDAASSADPYFRQSVQGQRIWNILKNLGPPVGTCGNSYQDKAGRYMGQTGITIPFVEK